MTSPTSAARSLRLDRSVRLVLVLLALTFGPASPGEAQVHWTGGAAEPGASAPAPLTETAWVMGGIATDFDFAVPARFVERHDGTATLTGLLESRSQPGLRFWLHLQLVGGMYPGDPSHPPVGSPKMDLLPGEYVGQGGTIDPSSWRYYPQGSALLLGLGALDDAVVQMKLHGPAFQVGIGASGRNVTFGASGWLTGKVITQPSTGVTLPTFVNADGAFDLGEEDVPCVREADADPSVGGVDGGHAFVFTEIGEFGVTTSATWNERENGTATLVASIASLSGEHRGFDVRIDLDERLDLGDVGYPPAGSPKKDLAPSTYAVNGGPVDTLSWHYYVQLAGTMEGTGAYEGALVKVERVGPALQVGVGANGKNTELGASSWLKLTTLRQPDGGTVLPPSFGGDMNVDLELECVICVREASPDRFGAGGENAFVLPGIGDDFRFAVPATFVEFADGTATLDGVVERASNPAESFHVELVFDDRIGPGDAAYPPTGSPKLALDPSAYDANGGPIDPSMWRYYRTSRGFLTGLGAYDGALLRLQETGPAFQIGAGANGKSTDFGASGWFVVQTFDQPKSGASFPQQFVGDGNFVLGQDCPPMNDLPHTEVTGGGCPGSENHVPELALLGLPAGGEPVGVRVRDALGGAPALLLVGRRGSHPMASGACALHLELPSAVVPFVLSSAGQGPGEGSAYWSLVVPPIAAGAVLPIQVAVGDPNGFDGLALSNALTVTLIP